MSLGLANPDDWEVFMATIPVHKRQWLDTLEPEERRRLLNHWWFWWVNVGQRLQGARQGRLFSDWEEGPWSENPDLDMRELERRAAAGDPRATLAFARALRRAGEEVPIELHARWFAAEHGADSIVTYPSGKQRKVKNLGWLRRQLHRRGGLVTGNMIPLRFIVRTGGEFPRECYLRVELDGEPGRGLRAASRGERVPDLQHTHTFETMFASCEHLWDWLQTPLFQNENLDWDGRIGKIDPKMHESTYGHPSGSEGGPDVQCHVCRRRFWSGDEKADPDAPRCPTCFASGRRRNPSEWAGRPVGPPQRGLMTKYSMVRGGYVIEIDGQEYFSGGIDWSSKDPRKISSLKNIRASSGRPLPVVFRVGGEHHGWGWAIPRAELVEVKPAVQRNSDEPARRIEREAMAGGDAHTQARHLMERVRAGEVPMAHVALAASWAGRRDARLLGPPPYDQQYLLADRRALVAWAMALSDKLPDPSRSRGKKGWSLLSGDLNRWLQGGKKPTRSTCNHESGAMALYSVACKMVWARSNKTLHQLVKQAFKLYRTRVYQRFMDELHGHHPDERLSPAWNYTIHGQPLVIEIAGGSRTDMLALRKATSHDASRILGRILLREE